MQEKKESILDLSIGEKYMLTVREASVYFHIDIKHMRRLAENNDGEFALFVGNRYLICRPQFENLWEEWFDTQLFLLAKGTPMARMGYSEIFECLPKEKQKELTDKKVEFARVAGIK